MPEGNEIHRWAERHTRAFVGKKLRVDSPTGRFADAAALDSRKLLEVRAKGKHLGYVFGKDRILHVHLGRYGDWTEGQMPLREPKGALRLRMWIPTRDGKTVTDGAPSKRHSWYSTDDGQNPVPPKDVQWLELRGPSDCSLWSDAQWAALMQRLGPDPLEGEHGDDPAPAFEKIARSKMSIAQLLMEQDVMAGIGNIYRAELLFRARMDPFVEGRAVPLKSLQAMWKDAIPLMKAGMVDRRIVTTRPKDRPTKKTGLPLKEEVHYVYRRAGKPCYVCSAKVSRKELAGRTLYWCPACQA